MAMYIAIRKRDENDDQATFNYFTSESLEGIVSLDKRAGVVVLVKASPDDVDGRLFSRVAYKLKRHWEQGDIPEATCWA